MMLSWVPFRAVSVEATFLMWAKIFEPSQYTWLGMRENTYLITFLILLGVFSTYTVQEKILPKFQNLKLVVSSADIILISVITALVIVFLRPINQFIYFQF